MRTPEEWLALTPAALMRETVRGEVGSQDVEIAKTLLGLRYQEQARDLALTQANSAKVMEEAARSQLAVNVEALAATKHQAKSAREAAAIAQRALQDNQSMIRYTMWVAIATAVAALVTLITQVALIWIELRKK